MKTLTKIVAVLLAVSSLSPLTPVAAQDAPPSGGGRRGGRGAGRGGAPEETWWVNKPAGGTAAYKAPMRPLWRLADLKKMHAGQNNWSQLIIRDTEQDVTYNSGAPGTRITHRMHPDTPTALVIIAGQMRVNVEGQAPTDATRGSIIHIMKTAPYSYEVIGNENALWIEINILGYTTLYPTTGAKPDAVPGAPAVKVAFPRSPVPYTGFNKLHFNTLDAIANCTVGPAVADDHMFINPLLGFVNPADNKCGGGGGNIGSGPAKPGDPSFNTKVPFGAPAFGRGGMVDRPGGRHQRQVREFRRIPRRGRRRPLCGADDLAPNGRRGAVRPLSPLGERRLSAHQHAEHRPHGTVRAVVPRCGISGADRRNRSMTSRVSFGSARRCRPTRT